MSTVKSPITGSYCSFYCNKNGIDYYKCEDTGTIFTPMELKQDNMVGGTGEMSRNFEQNDERISRLRKLCDVPTVLDFGCGNGYFVQRMLEKGIEAIGYDAYNENFNKIPAYKFDIVTMIEVIEHTFYPFSELDQIFKALKENGILYIETSFSNWVDENHDYLNPDIGHCTIFSHFGLNVLMEKKGFETISPINNNVRLYKKKK